MPAKNDPYSSYGQKLISLFAKLLFSGEKHSLSELAILLDCSKQSVLRLVNDIRKSYGVEIEETIEERRRYYRLKQLRGQKPILHLTPGELTTLQMCQAFTEHLLGKELFEAASQALEKGRAFLPDNKTVSHRHFASFHPGSVDYTPHRNTLQTLIGAMDNKKACKLSYQGVGRKKAISYYIEPLKIFSYRDTIYVHARKARTPGKPYTTPDFDPLLVVHRIKKIEQADFSYKIPAGYNFEKVFNQNFGIIKDDSFRVEVEFSGFAAAYISERIWSPDQKITKSKGDKVKLSFTASSEPEMVGWLLSWGENAKVLNPDWLVDEMKEKTKRILNNYS